MSIGGGNLSQADKDALVVRVTLLRDVFQNLPELLTNRHKHNKKKHEHTEKEHINTPEKNRRR